MLHKAIEHTSETGIVRVSTWQLSDELSRRLGAAKVTVYVHMQHTAVRELSPSTKHPASSLTFTPETPSQGATDRSHLQTVCAPYRRAWPP